MNLYILHSNFDTLTETIGNFGQLVYKYVDSFLLSTLMNSFCNVLIQIERCFTYTGNKILCTIICNYVADLG